MKKRNLMSFGYIVLLILLFIAAYFRNTIWKRDVTLYEDVVKKSPIKARVHNNLGVAYSRQGRIDEAMQEYLIAIKLKPYFVEAHNNLGNIYHIQGRYDEAIQEYLIALRIKPDYTLAQYNLWRASFTP